MADYTRSFVGRAAAILTTAEVAGTTLNLLSSKPDKWELCADCAFTLGSLTNGIFRFYASIDGTNFDLIYVGGTSSAITLTADANLCVVIPPLAGYKYFRASVEGTGTVASSSAAVTYRYMRRGAL